MRSVIGTAPSRFGRSALAAPEPLCTAVLFASAGTHAAITVVAAVPPVVKRNVRRVGFDGPDFGWSSSRIGPSVEVKELIKATPEPSILLRGKRRPSSES